MRKILNVSLPKATYDFVAEQTKKKKFSTKSEFIRHLLRRYEAKLLLAEIKQAREDMKSGKGRPIEELFGDIS